MNKEEREKIKSKLRLIGIESELLYSIIDIKEEIDDKLVSKLLVTEGQELLTLLAKELTIQEMEHTIYRHLYSALRYGVMFKIYNEILYNINNENYELNILSKDHEKFYVLPSNLNDRLLENIDALEDGDELIIGKISIKKESTVCNLYEDGKLLETNVTIQYLHIDYFKRDNKYMDKSYLQYKSEENTIVDLRLDECIQKLGELRQRKERDNDSRR